MSKTIPGALSTLIGSEVSTLAVCWKITNTNGTILYSTAHTEDIVILTETYKSVYGFSPDSVPTSTGLNVDTVSLETLFDPTAMTEQDILAGVWDFSSLEFFLVNWESPTDGIIKLRKGTVGQISTKRLSFVSEIRGMMEAYTRELHEYYSPGCRADLGDARCQVELSLYTTAGTVSAVTNRRVFQASALLPAATLDGDAFNRANAGDLGTEWVEDVGGTDGIGIVSNQAAMTTLDYNTSQFQAISLNADCWAEVTIGTFIATTPYRTVALCLRSTDYGTAPVSEYCAFCDKDGGTEIYKNVAGSVSLVTSEGSTAWASGDRIRFECEGTALRVYQNSTLVLSGSDGAITAGGYAALVMENYDGILTQVTADDFRVGNLATTAGDDFFRGGLLTWVTGNNAGRSMEVKKYTASSKTLELSLPMPEDIAITDTFTVTQGCDKSIATCNSTYQNSLNFRGEPYVPQKAELSVATYLE